MSKLAPGMLCAAVLGAALFFAIPRGTHVEVHRAAAYDTSPPLASLRADPAPTAAPECEPSEGCGASPADPEQDNRGGANPPPPPPPVSPQAAAIEQKTQGPHSPAALVASFDGLGVGFEGPQGPSTGRNPSDNSLAVGPDHVVQIVNSRMAVFDKKGKVLYGAVPTNTLFKGFGGPCEARNNGDAVVRYDQLAGRWLYVMPLFQRIPDRPEEPYAMCYAVSAGADPLGPYHRYEFRRKLFPDYPRPAIWTDGYYVPSSTGDTVIQKHTCIVDRAKMLAGTDATEQCIIIDGVNFLNNADIDGSALPPAGAPNIMMAAGGTQLHNIFEDDGIYAWQVHVDWGQPGNTKAEGPVKIAVAPYHYLCNGQLTNCVPQPDTTRRLDAQGDKLMQRLVYRNWGGHESIVAVHSVNTSAGGGGVRWYEFRLDAKRAPVLYQQGTYAPEGFYRWMASPGMDKQGNIAIGYSFGGTPNYAGQHLAARLASDPPGALTFQETILARGEAAQTSGNRWEDYASMAMDPDDCTFWYVGDYVKAGANTYSTRIGGLRLPGCLTRPVTGAVYFDRNHDGRRDPGEPGIANWPIEGAPKPIASGRDGNYSAEIAADPAYPGTGPTLAAKASGNAAWVRTGGATDFGNVCQVRNQHFEKPGYWTGKGKAVMQAHDGAWQSLINTQLHLTNKDGSPFSVSGDFNQAYSQFQKWLKSAPPAQAQLAAAALSAASQDLGEAVVHDPVADDWPTLRTLVGRVNSGNADRYRPLFEQLNSNSAMITPASPSACPPPF